MLPRALVPSFFLSLSLLVGCTSLPPSGCVCDEGVCDADGVELWLELGTDGTFAGLKRVKWFWAPEAQRWHHLAVTVGLSPGGPPALGLRVDGVDQGPAIAIQGPTVVDALHDAADPFRIGGQPTQNFIDAMVDGVRVWSVARKPSQLDADRFIELDGTEPGLVGYWRFNESYADETPNGNHLVPSGAASFTPYGPF